MLLFTSDSMPSMMSTPRSCFVSATASAASNVHPPTKTESAAEQPLLRFVEQVVAPGDRAAQRLLAFGQIARAAGEDLQAALQSSQHRRGRQRLDARRRQLDGQRQPVEAIADLGNRARVLAGQREVGL